jgi:hypothetical protein
MVYFKTVTCKQHKIIIGKLLFSFSVSPIFKLDVQPVPIYLYV